MQYLVADINCFTDSEIQAALSQMPLEQKEYITNKKCELSRKQSIVARILVKKLLLNFGICDGYNISFDTNGKPCYSNSSDVYLSVSHSKEVVAAAVSNKPVGIDIQVYKKINDKLVDKVCSNEECRFVKSEGDKFFFKIWTVKEAYSKCTQMKLSDVFKLSFVKDDSIYGLDKKLYSYSTDLYELSIIE